MTFDEFVAARLGALLRYATVVTCDPHLAQDVTQEVLIRVRDKWGRIEGLQSPERYVRRMILNEFLSWRRRAETSRTSPAGWELHESPDAGTGAQAQVDDRDLLLRLIADLPPRQRAVVALRYYEDLSDDEIAELMNCRPVTVRTQASRALATLRRALPLALPTPSGGTR